MNKKKTLAYFISLLFHWTCSASEPVVDKDWRAWLENFGHDNYRYPAWISDQKKDCQCQKNSGDKKAFTCNSTNMGRTAATKKYLNWCDTKEWLLNHMPKFDQYFMPPSLSVEGDSMFDDNIAFALMADRANRWSTSIPINVRLQYILPYASYHESRGNWRPLFFAKFFQLVSSSSSPLEAIENLLAPNAFLNWTSNNWKSRPILDQQTDYNLKWSSSTSPPIIDPFSFISYGYSSCTGWATLITYILRSVGIPARQVGTPCWNSIYGGVDYTGPALRNPNVSICWHGGIGSESGDVGGIYLNNHNWVEWWHNGSWVFQNVPPSTSSPNSPSLCGNWTKRHGCGWSEKDGCTKVSGGPAAASVDHEIYAITWSDSSDIPSSIDGGRVLDVASITLTSGEPVSPLVWSPMLKSPVGVSLVRESLRVVNRTDFYRCKE